MNSTFSFRFYDDKKLAVGARHLKYGTITHKHMRVYPKVSGLAAWIKNCKWYSSLQLSAVLSLFCGSV